MRTQLVTDDLGATLMIDGKPAGVIDGQTPPLRVAPGKHLFHLVRNGKTGAPYEESCLAGGRIDLQMSLSQRQSSFPWTSLVLLDEQLDASLGPLRDELGAQLERVNVLLVPTDRATQARAGHSGPAASECDQLRCFDPVLDCLSAQFVLRIGPATAKGPARYQLALRDHRVWQGIGYYQNEVDIAAGSPSDQAQQLAAAALALILQPAQLSPGAVEIAASRSDAQLYLDDKLVGTPIWSTRLYPGEYSVSARRPGYVSQPQPLSIPAAPQGTIRLNIPLSLDPDLLRRRARQRGLAWSALVVGALSAGAGAALLALDGNGVDCDPQNPGICTQRLNTQAGGSVATGAGGALLGAAIVLFGVSARGPR